MEVAPCKPFSNMVDTAEIIACSYLIDSMVIILEMQGKKIGGGIYFKMLTVVGYIYCSPFGSHMSYKFKFANKLYKGNSATSLCQP